MSHTLHMVTHDSDFPLTVIFLMPSFTNCPIVFLSSYWHGQILMQTTHSILNFAVVKCCCTSEAYNNSSMWWWTLSVQHMCGGFVLGPMHGNITKMWPVLYCVTNSVLTKEAILEGQCNLFVCTLPSSKEWRLLFCISFIQPVKEPFQWHIKMSLSIIYFMSIHQLL